MTDTIESGSPSSVDDTNLQATVDEADPWAPPGDPDAAINMSDVTKTYGRFTALNRFNLVVPNDSIFGIVGPNGAGKTTAISMVATLLKPTSGSIRVLGVDPVKHPRQIRSQLGYMPDGIGMYDSLSVQEYLEFFASAFKIRPERWTELIDGLLELVGMQHRRRDSVDALSKGLKQRVSLARALINDPSILVLDEPANGLDPRARSELRDLIVQLHSMGKTIVVSSHILSDIEDICTDIAIVQQGTRLLQGSNADVIKRLGATTRVRVRFTDGTAEEHDVDNPEAQAELLRRLIVDDGREVMEFTQVGGRLEDVFLAITKDIADE